MVNREENIASDSSSEDGSDDQPRDLQELLLWHQELSSQPSRVGNNPRKRQGLWKHFQVETEHLLRQQANEIHPPLFSFSSFSASSSPVCWESITLVFFAQV